MFKRIFLFTVMAVVMMIEMPFATSAATVTKNATLSKPQFQMRIGTRNRRYRRHYGWERRREGREVGRYVLVPQYYWMDGRRYVRYVRVYRNF